MHSTNKIPSSKSDVLHIKNTAGFIVYVRVYGIADHAEVFGISGPIFRISGTYPINPDKTLELKIQAPLDSSRILCYLNAKDEKRAEAEIFRNNEFSPVAHTLEIPTNEGKDEPIKLIIPKFDPVLDIPEFKWLEIWNTFKVLEEFATGLSTKQLKLTDTTINDGVDRSKAKKKSKSDIAYSMSERNIEISEIERNNLIERNKVVNKSINNLLTQCGITIPENLILKTPMIGVSGSGGGFRAMIGFRGFNTGLYECGLIDTIQYCSGTSGSTWAMTELRILSALTENRENFEKYLNLYPEMVAKSMESGIYQNWESILSANNVYRKLIKEQLLRVDERKTSTLTLWSARLSIAALSGVQELNLKLGNNTKTKIGKLGKDVRQLTASKTTYYPEIGPIHIYNAIAASDHPEHETSFVDMFEFNGWDMTLIPDERSVGKNCAWRIPAESFGKSFSGSIPKESLSGKVPADIGESVPLSNAKLIGTTGSAMTPDKKKIRSFISEKLSGWLSKNQSKSTQSAETIDLQDEQARNNVTGIIHGQTITAPFGNEITLRDAGLFCNNPLYALMRRGCNINIVYDTSGDLESNVNAPCYELMLAVENAKSLNKKLCHELNCLPNDTKPFYDKVSKAIKNAEYPIVFGNPDDPDEICIVYIPTAKSSCKLFKDKKIRWDKFDPMVSTVKLNYEREEVNTLHEYGRLLCHAVNHKLKEIIVRRAIAMNGLMPLPSDERYTKYIAGMASSDFISPEAIKTMTDTLTLEQFDQVSRELTSLVDSEKNVNNIIKLKYPSLVVEARNKINETFRVISNSELTPSLLFELLLDIVTYDKLISPHILSEIIKQAISNYKLTPKAEEWISDIVKCANNGDQYYKVFVRIVSLHDLPNSEKLSTLLEQTLTAASKHKTPQLKVMSHNIRILLSQIHGLSEIVCVNGSHDIIRVNSAGELHVLFTGIQRFEFNKHALRGHMSGLLLDTFFPDNLWTELKEAGDIIGILRESDNESLRNLAMRRLIESKDKAYFEVDYYECLTGLIDTKTTDDDKYDIYMKLYQAYTKTQNYRGRYRALKQALQIRNSETTVKEMKVLLGDISANLLKCTNHGSHASNETIAKLNIYFEILQDANALPKALLSIASKNDTSVEIFDYLLKNLKTEQIMQCDSEEWNAAHHAAQNDNPEFLKRLILNYSDMFNAITKEGDTPALVAAKYGCVNSFQSMLSVLSQSQISKTNKQKNAVHLATCRDNEEILSLIFDKYPEMFACTTKGGATSTILAVIRKCDRSLRFLCDKGIDINKADDQRHPPIYHACTNNNITAFNILVDAGAEYDHSVLLHKAHELKHYDLIGTMLFTERLGVVAPRGLIPEADVPMAIWQNIFLHACRNGNLKYAAYLLNKEIEIKEAGIINKDTSLPALTLALELSYLNGNLDLFAMLLAAGADPNKFRTKSTGDTMLLDSYRKGKKEYMNRLLLKADPDIQNKHGESCLSWSFNKDDIEMFRTFLAHGAKCIVYPRIHTSDSASGKALNAATQVASLITNKATASSNLLVQACCSSKTTRYVELMLQYKGRFDVNAVDDKKLNALSAAYYYSCKNTFELLIANGANPNDQYCGKDDKTIFVNACLEGKQEFIDLMCKHPDTVKLVKLINDCKYSEAEKLLGAGDIDLSKIKSIEHQLNTSKIYDIETQKMNWFMRKARRTPNVEAINNMLLKIEHKAQSYAPVIDRQGKAL